MQANGPVCAASVPRPIERDVDLLGQCADHLFSPAAQFTMTVNGGVGEDADAVDALLAIKKRFPSAATSYWNARVSGAIAIWASNIATGELWSNTGFGPGPVFTATDINLPSPAT